MDPGEAVHNHRRFFFFRLLPLFLAAIPLSIGSIHTYDREVLREVGNAYLLAGGSEGIVGSRDSAPSPFSTSSSASAFRSSLHDGRSFIRFQNITFWRSKEAADLHTDMEHSSGLVQVVIFEAADRDDIGGSAYGGQRSICCTPDLAKLEGCKQGEIIRIQASKDEKWPVVIDIHFSGNFISTEMGDMVVDITKTGMYNLFFISCNPELKGLIVNGRTLWKNPDGFLPGRMAPLMKFYIFMSLAYLLLSFVWFIQYVRFWKDVLQLQHWITIVIALGWFEMALWYFDYANFNNNGIRPVAITTWVVTVGAVRRTVSRLLILSVSMGYGVVRPTLGGLTSKVVLIGITYFLATELLDITEYVGIINDISGRARLFLVLPDAFLDTFLILWIFTSLSRTLEQLQV
ncbi:hypothetical protein Dimus_018008 [Dionaea muscipula]